MNRLLAIARALPPHRFTMVAPHPELARPRATHALGADVPVLQAPRLLARNVVWPPARRERTLGDVFHAIGYAQSEPLAGLARAWRDILARLGPDLIICDFAPTLRLANRDHVPVIVASDCFGVPPQGIPCPPLFPDAPADAASAGHEDELTAAARRVAEAVGSKPVRGFSELFCGTATFPLGIRLVDPYAAWRTGPQRQPIGFEAIRCGPEHADRTGPPIFCYLWVHHPALNAIVSALNRLTIPSRIFVRGLDPAVLAKHCAPQVGVLTTEADFARVLPQTRLFLHYGGGGATFAGLMAGTVQVVMPTLLEQEASAARVADAGVALALKLGPDADPDALARLLADAYEDAGKRVAALRRAAEAASLPLVDTPGEIRSVCARLLGEAA